MARRGGAGRERAPVGQGRARAPAGDEDEQLGGDDPDRQERDPEEQDVAGRNDDNEDTEGCDTEGGDDDDDEEDEQSQLLSESAQRERNTNRRMGEIEAAFNRQLQALQTQIATLTAALQAQQASGGAAPRAGGTAFALTPALSQGPGAIDYSGRDGGKVYSTGSSKLHEDPLELTVKGVSAMRASLKSRATTQGWIDTIFRIRKKPNDPTDLSTWDLLTHDGQITIDEIRADAALYMAREDRRAQDQVQFGAALLASITQEATEKLDLVRDQYVMASHNGLKVAVGTLLFKVIIQESQLDTAATTFVMEEKFFVFPEQMSSVYHNDVRAWVEGFKKLLEQLESRGSPAVHSALHLSWRACEQITNEEFKSWHEHARNRMQFEASVVYTPKEYLRMMTAMYDSIEERGTWNVVGEEQKEILALSTEVSTLKERLKQVTIHSPGKGTGKGGGKGGNGGKGRKNGGNGGGGGKGGLKRWEKPWMFEAPKAGQPHTKSVEGRKKPYHWCPNHKKWVAHKPSECEGVGGKRKGNGDRDKDKTTPDAKRARLSKALQAIAQEALEDRE